MIPNLSGVSKMWASPIQSANREIVSVAVHTKATQSSPPSYIHDQAALPRGALAAPVPCGLCPNPGELSDHVFDHPGILQLP